MKFDILILILHNLNIKLYYITHLLSKFIIVFQILLTKNLNNESLLGHLENLDMMFERLAQTGKRNLTASQSDLDADMTFPSVKQGLMAAFHRGNAKAVDKVIKVFC